VLVAGRWLLVLVLVAGCWLLVAGCWLLVAGCWLLGVPETFDLAVSLCPLA
jgi:hypothetical protein